MTNPSQPSQILKILEKVRREQSRFMKQEEQTRHVSRFASVDNKKEAAGDGLKPARNQIYSMSRNRYGEISQTLMNLAKQQRVQSDNKRLVN